MPTLREILLGSNPQNLDNYMLGLHKKANNIANQKAMESGVRVVASEEIGVELMKLFANELNQVDFTGDYIQQMYDALYQWNPQSQDGEIRQKCGAVQSFLMSYLNPQESEECSHRVQVDKLIDRIQIDKLLGLCDEYKNHLIKDTKFNRVQMESTEPASIKDHSLKLAVEKYKAVDEMTRGLRNNDISNSDKLSRFHDTFAQKKGRIGENRESKAMSFLKAVANIFSFGLTVKFNAWKTAGTKLGEEVEQELAKRPKQ